MFRDNGDIYNDLSSIVINELKNIEVDEIKEKHIIRQIIDNIYRRYNHMLKQYQMIIFKKSKKDAEENGNSKENKKIAKSVNQTIQTYLSPAIFESINVHMKKLNVDTNNFPEEFNDYEF